VIVSRASFVRRHKFFSWCLAMSSAAASASSTAASSSASSSVSALVDSPVADSANRGSKSPNPRLSPPHSLSADQPGSSSDALSLLTSSSSSDELPRLPSSATSSLPLISHVVADGIVEHADGRERGAKKRKPNTDAGMASQPAVGTDDSPFFSHEQQHPSEITRGHAPHQDQKQQQREVTGEQAPHRPDFNQQQQQQQQQRDFNQQQQQQRDFNQHQQQQRDFNQHQQQQQHQQQHQQQQRDFNQQQQRGFNQQPREVTGGHAPHRFDFNQQQQQQQQQHLAQRLAQQQRSAAGASVTHAQLQLPSNASVGYSNLNPNPTPTPNLHSLPLTHTPYQPTFSGAQMINPHPTPNPYSLPPPANRQPLSLISPRAGTATPRPTSPRPILNNPHAGTTQQVVLPPGMSFVTPNLSQNLPALDSGSFSVHPLSSIAADSDIGGPLMDHDNMSGAPHPPSTDFKFEVEPCRLDRTVNATCMLNLYNCYIDNEEFNTMPVFKTMPLPNWPPFISHVTNIEEMTKGFHFPALSQCTMDVWFQILQGSIKYFASYVMEQKRKSSSPIVRRSIEVKNGMYTYQDPQYHATWLQELNRQAPITDFQDWTVVSILHFPNPMLFNQYLMMALNLASRAGVSVDKFPEYQFWAVIPDSDWSPSQVHPVTWNGMQHSFWSKVGGVLVAKCLSDLLITLPPDVGRVNILMGRMVVHDKLATHPKNRKITEHSPFTTQCSSYVSLNHNSTSSPTSNYVIVPNATQLYTDISFTIEPPPKRSVARV
jgi:hypothetical protein